jgi:hypothetical protein
MGNEYNPDLQPWELEEEYPDVSNYPGEPGEQAAIPGGAQELSHDVARPIKSKGQPVTIEARRTFFNCDAQEFTNPNIGVVPAQVLTANPSRNYLAIQNQSASDMFVTFTQQNRAGGIRIAAGGSYEPLVAPRGTIYLRSENAGPNRASIVQGLV